MKIPRYCKGCKIELSESFFGGKQFFSFEDGDYCIKCAKIRIEKARNKIEKSN